MTCYHPISACYSKSHFAKTGKKVIHPVLDDSDPVKYILNEKEYPHALYEYIHLPCRKCAGCRSDNAKMWSIRAQNEMKMHKYNCFITLTYADDNPYIYDDPLCICDLRYKHFQNFIKRLRKRFPEDKFSYLVCGEYGLQGGRAHWHAILFGFDFPDKQLVYVDKGFNHYHSDIFEELWSLNGQRIGIVDLADCDVDCCNYVSQYVLKKLPLDNNGLVIANVNGDNVEYIPSCPPIVRSSKNPAIGKRWFDRYGVQAVENGVIRRTNKGLTRYYKTPEYYYKKFEEINPERFEVLKNIKQEKMKEYYEKHPVDRQKLKLREDSHLYKIMSKIKKCLKKFKL